MIFFFEQEKSTVERKDNFLSIKDDDFIVNKNQPFTFYEKTNRIIYFGKKHLNKIYCLDYDKFNHTIECSQIILIDKIIHEICFAPDWHLDKDKSEIAK